MKKLPAKKWIIVAVVVVVIILLLLLLGGGKGKGAYSEETAQTRDITTYYSYDGNIVAKDSQKVISKSTMAVETFHVKVGDVVEKGTLLCELDNDALQDSLDSASATYEIAKINAATATGPSAEVQRLAAENDYENAKVAAENAKKNLAQAEALYAAGALSEYDLNAARNGAAQAERGAEMAEASLRTTLASIDATASTTAQQLKQAQAQLSSLERQMEDTFIKAEVSGEITEIHVTEGESVTVGTPIMDLIDYDTLEVTIRIDEYDLNSIEEGKEALVYIPALDREVKGTITKIAREATVANGVSYFAATVTLNEGTDMRIGLTVEVKILSAYAPEATSVSVKAVQYNAENQPFVYIKSGGGMTERAVTLGASNGTYIEITEGLAPGEVVMVPLTFNPMTMSME